MNKKSILYILAAGGFIQLNIIFSSSIGYENISLAKINPLSGQNTVTEIAENTTQEKATTKNEVLENNKTMSLIRDVSKECVVIGPFYGKSDTQINNLIVGYEPDFKNKLKTHEIKKETWNIIVSSENAESPSKIMERFQDIGIDLDNVMFQENGDIFVKSFDKQNDAIDFSHSLYKKGQDNHLVQDNRNEYYYYIINPSERHYARLQAFDTYFEDTSIKEIDCNKDNNKTDEQQ